MQIDRFETLISIKISFKLIAFSFDEKVNEYLAIELMISKSDNVHHLLSMNIISDKLKFLLAYYRRKKIYENRFDCQKDLS